MKLYISTLAIILWSTSSLGKGLAGSSHIQTPDFPSSIKAESFIQIPGKRQPLPVHAKVSSGQDLALHGKCEVVSDSGISNPCWGMVVLIDNQGVYLGTEQPISVHVPNATDFRNPVSLTFNSNLDNTLGSEIWTWVFADNREVFDQFNVGGKYDSIKSQFWFVNTNGETCQPDESCYINLGNNIYGKVWLNRWVYFNHVSK